MKPVRILLVNTYTEAVGGAETYLLASQAELESRGHTTALFGTGAERDLDTTTLRVVKRPEWAAERLFQDPAVSDAYRAFAEGFRPDLIHVHNLHSLGLDLLDAIADTGVPVVQTVHDFSVLCPNSWCVRGDGSACPGGAGAMCFEHNCTANYPFDARQVLHAKLRLARTRDLVDVAISPSTTLADQLRLAGFRDVRHVHYFVDTDQFPVASKPRDAKALLFLGRLVPEKGLDVLIEAMAEVAREEPEARLTVLGDGMERAPLEARAGELGLASSVRFVSKVPHAEVQGFIAKAGALVVPSTWSENSPVSIHESLAAGLPVVASNIGGIPDLVIPGETGWLARARDAADLAQKLIAAIRCPADDRTRMAAAGRTFAETLTRERNLGALEAIYTELIEKPRRSRQAPSLAWDSDLLAVIGRAASQPGPAPLPLTKLVRRKVRKLFRRT